MAINAKKSACVRVGSRFTHRCSTVSTLDGMGEKLGEIYNIYSRGKQAPRRIALFNKADWSSFRMFVSNLGKEIAHAASRSANSETLWQMFKDKIDEGVQLFIPFKTTKPRDSQPWIDRKLNVKYA